MAEGKIKGITVEIGGNTDPLAKALKEMNKPLNSMQKELKGIESLLKMDPSNVDLLRQKEELLNKSIGDTESKLEALKKAKDAADKQMANGTKVNQTEYRNLVREIASTEQKLERLTDSMKEFGSVFAGIIGATCATLGVVLPSFIIILIVAKCYDAFKSSTAVKGAMTGLKPAAIGLIGAAVYKIGMTVFFPNGFTTAVFTGAPFYISLVLFAVMAFLTFKVKLHPIIIICVSAAVGIAAGYLLQLPV